MKVWNAAWDRCVCRFEPCGTDGVLYAADHAASFLLQLVNKNKTNLSIRNEAEYEAVLRYASDHGYCIEVPADFTFNN